MGKWLIGRLSVGAAVTVGVLMLTTPALAANDGHADATTPGGKTRVSAVCAESVRSASVSATTIGGSSNISMASGATPGSFHVDLTVPRSTMPGTYHLGGTCGDGSGFTASLTVTPHGGAQGGAGSTSQGPSSTVLVAGAGLLLAGGLGGGLALLRRRSNGAALG